MGVVFFFYFLVVEFKKDLHTRDFFFFFLSSNGKLFPFLALHRYWDMAVEVCFVEF